MTQLVVLTGRSGSGKTSALHNLEDAGYYCVDNIPLELLLSLLKTLEGKYDKIAVNLDVRNLTEPSSNNVVSYIEALRKQIEVLLIYLESDNLSLLKRYSESRRIHPLSLKDANLSLEDAIAEEEKQLTTIRAQANLVIDTSGLSIHQLNHQVHEKILGKSMKRLKLVFQSFGFKHGVPPDSDYVFDVRFLPNPHWIEELRPQTGLDQPVRAYLSQQAEVEEVIWQIKTFISNWLPSLQQNNRSYVTVAIGCTGGQHRSVYVADSLAKVFKKVHGDVAIIHRELSKML